MCVIAVACKKGGVGKTTVSLNMGVALVALGYDVALVDMDPQGQISVSFDMVDEAGKPVEGIFDLLVNGARFDEVIFQAPADEYEKIVRKAGGCLVVLPGGIKTQLAAVNVQLEGGTFDVVREAAVDPLRKIVDVVIIDTAPSNSLFTGGIYNASDWVLVPTMLERLSLDSLDKTVQEMVNLKKLHDAKLLGIVPMMTHPRTIEHKARLSELRANYQEYVWGGEGIRHSTVWKRASDQARSIFSYNGGAEAAQAQMWKLVEKLIQEVGLDGK